MAHDKIASFPGLLPEAWERGYENKQISAQCQHLLLADLCHDCRSLWCRVDIHGRGVKGHHRDGSV